jgi:hypothetical protein
MYLPACYAVPYFHLKQDTQEVGARDAQVEGALPQDVQMLWTKP